MIPFSVTALEEEEVHVKIYPPPEFFAVPADNHEDPGIHDEKGEAEEEVSAIIPLRHDQLFNREAKLISLSFSTSSHTISSGNGTVDASAMA